MYASKFIDKGRVSIVHTAHTVHRPLGVLLYKILFLSKIVLLPTVHVQLITNNRNF